MITVEKLRDDLEFWLFITIGDDIVRLPEQRPEYQHLVKKVRKTEPLARTNEEIALTVLYFLKRECEKPTLLRPTFYRLLWLSVKQFFSKL